MNLHSPKSSTGAEKATATRTSDGTHPYPTPLTKGKNQNLPALEADLPADTENVSVWSPAPQDARNTVVTLMKKPLLSCFGEYLTARQPVKQIMFVGPQRKSVSSYRAEGNDDA